MIDKKQVVALHRQGLTQREIAEAMGCSQPSVNVALRSVGITRNSVGLSALWISVKDGLPEHPHPVLVTISNANYKRPRFVQIARYDNGHWIVPRGVGRVVAWMDLPEEYQG